MDASTPIRHPAERRARGARKHRAIQVALLGLSATLIPALFAARAIWSTGSAQLAVMVVWLVAWVGFAIALLAFRCPQCGRPFHRDGGMLSAFNDRCVHCAYALTGGNRRVSR
jgi:hypothetical protein